MMTVVVDNVLSVQSYGSAIFNATCTKNERHRFVADYRVMPRPPYPGEVWDIIGTPARHHQYGLQIHLSKAVLKRPSGRLIIRTISDSKLFPGIGVATATGLYERYGDDIYRMLGQNDPSLFEEAIGLSLSKVLASGWQQMAVDTDVYQWLALHGLPVQLSMRLIDLYGSETAAKLEENPYRLLAFTSWEKADALASAMGIARDDERRLVAAVDATIYMSLGAEGFNRGTDKSTWVDERTFRRRLKQRILGRNQQTLDRALSLALAENAIIEVSGGLQGLGPWSMEQYIVQRIADIVSGAFDAEQASIRFNPSDTDLESIYQRFQTSRGISLNAEQKAAVKMALSCPVSILSGGAGVGKTTVLKAICEGAERFGGRIILMAVSGRAARRITEATGREAMTIARFLNRVDRGEISLDGEPTIAIDESSMLDLPTTYRILRRMVPGCRLLFIGDPGQLPPVSFGLVYHILTESALVPQTRLTEIHRQAAETGIPQFSRDIREGKVPQFSEYNGKERGVSFVECGEDGLLDEILKVVDDLGGEFKEIRIISMIRAGIRPISTRRINSHLYTAKAHGRQPERDGFALFEPVIWNKNNYELGLMNGTLGFVEGVSDGLVVAWDDSGSTKLGGYLDMDRAYAITCHKSQGSAFKRVIIPVFKSKLLDRTMLYTAVTRAQEQVVIIGDRDAFEKAVVSPPTTSVRKTGLHFLLREEHGHLPRL